MGVRELSPWDDDERTDPMTEDYESGRLRGL